MKPLIIYHADCTDGFCAAFAAWLKFRGEAEYKAFQYGSGEFPICLGRDVYILDFSFPREDMEKIFDMANRVVWLDHHKTAFEMWCGQPLERYGPALPEKGFPHYILLDNSKSGALLAWEYFHPGTEAPLLIRHIDDRDRWQFKLEGSKELHAALASYKPWNFEQWAAILRINHTMKFEYGYGVPAELYDQGTAILRAQDANIQSMLKQARKCRMLKRKKAPGLSAPWEGIQQFDGYADYQAVGLALNTPMHMSEVGHELAKQSGTYGLVYYLGADNKVKCSLRSEGDYDVSAIAKAFGGGGHRNAAGFETDINTLMGWLK